MNRQPVDRVAILEQLSYNPAVIAAYTGKKIDGFDYGQDDICATIRQTIDLCMIPVPVRRADRVRTEDGFVIKH